jgi:SAM-dependent methyltransferase
VHYNNVIEHQFNPLFTLLNIRRVLKNNGYLILGCPLKPKWITTNDCHFHEFDKKAYYEIISRADFKEINSIKFSYVFSVKG